MIQGELVDAELRGRAAEQERIAAALLALERHPGTALLTRTAVTGTTAAAWAPARDALQGLWRDFTLFRATLRTARTVRGARVRPDDDTLAELRRLLEQPSVEVSGAPVEPSGDGRAGPAETVSLDQLSARMHGALEQVGELATRVVRAQERTLAALAPLAEGLLAATTLARALGTADPELTELDGRVAELVRRAGGDPLALDGPDPVPAELADRLTAARRRLEAVAEVRAGWDERKAALEQSLERLAALGEQATESRRRAEDAVGPDTPPTPPDALPELRARRAELESTPDWPARARLLSELTELVREHETVLRETLERTAGLLERRAELRERFEALRSRAPRRGPAEDPELVRVEDRVRATLWSRPADLAGGARAVADYQKLVRGTGDQTGRGSRG